MASIVLLFAYIFEDSELDNYSAQQALVNDEGGYHWLWYCRLIP